MVDLANVDNTSDLAKPIATATQNALNAKQNEPIFPTSEGANGWGVIHSTNAARRLAVVMNNAPGTSERPLQVNFLSVSLLLHLYM